MTTINFRVNPYIPEEITAEFLVLRQLKKIDRNDGRIIYFPVIFARLGKILHLNKKESFQVLKQLSGKRKLEIVPAVGVRMLREDCNGRR